MGGGGGGGYLRTVTDRSDPELGEHSLVPLALVLASDSVALYAPRY
jgi:hypothetical protein